MQEVNIMLIQFRFQNYKSFKEETVLDMTATSQREHSDFLIEKNENKVLPVAVFFGGNANGKSNLIEAFFRMIYSIIMTYDIDENQDLEANPYIFDESIEEPTAFEIVLAIEDIEYKYGFILDSNKIHQEWLLQRPFKKSSTANYKKLFEREENDIKLYSEFKEYELLKSLVKEKNLFLSILGRRRENIAKDIYGWAAHTDFEMFDTENDQRILEILYSDKKLFEQVKREIKEVDNCIFNMKIIKEINRLNNKFIYKLEAIHRIADKEFECPFEIESSGTIKLFYLYYKIYKILNRGGVLFIDELDSKIHSLVLKHIISLFNDREINKNNAQIVFSCHNTWLLENKLLRRDQIWFIKKDNKGISEIYSLADFKDVRSDLDYNKAYLSGKFGAIPYMERKK